MKDVVSYNLRSILDELFKTQTNITEAYIFGSRAYGTQSLRSDCDILLNKTEDSFVRECDLRDFAVSICPALDFFIGNGGKVHSCMNGSYLYAFSFNALVERLDAIKLWSRDEGYTEFSFSDGDGWEFSVHENVSHIATVLPNKHADDISIHSAFRRAERKSLPIRPFLGDTIDTATSQIVEIVSRMIIKSDGFSKRGRAKIGWHTKLESEYDCQDLFYLTVKPWLPNLGREEVEIIYDGQAKISDFSLFDGKLIIEMKFIDSDNKKREVVKTLAGLSEFYSRNANVVTLLMLICATNDANVDQYKWEADYSYLTKSPRVVTRVIHV